MRGPSRCFSSMMMGGLAAALIAATSCSAQSVVSPTASSPDLDIASTQVRWLDDLGILVFEQVVEGVAGATTPEEAGGLDGAPVLGYVFPTTLAPTDVGFADGDGVVALAATSHPDFDDTPLWDENGDRDYSNDGVRFHSHWVLLVPDDRVPGGLSVKETQQIDADLPPTNPGMPIYLDSPGFSIALRGDTLRVVVPVDRVSGNTEFGFDAVTAYLEVNTSDDSRPMLGVYEVYEVFSGDLSLPYRITKGGRR